MYWCLYFAVKLKTGVSCLPTHDVTVSLRQDIYLAFEISLFNLWRKPPSIASRDIFRIFGCMWFLCLIPSTLTFRTCHYTTFSNSPLLALFDFLLIVHDITPRSIEMWHNISAVCVQTLYAVLAGIHWPISTLAEALYGGSKKMERCLKIDTISSPHELSVVRPLQLKAGGR